jgi:hypothetical protein
MGIFQFRYCGFALNEYCQPAKIVSATSGHDWHPVTGQGGELCKCQGLLFTLAGTRNVVKSLT